MHNKSLKQYCFINKFNVSELSKINNDVGIIFRNYNNGKKLETIKKLKQYCRKYDKKLFLSNDIKLAIRLNLNGAYIPSFNKNIIHKSYLLKKDFEILGSAHNISEINLKKKQGVRIFFIAPVFKFKKKILGIYGFLKLKQFSKSKCIALGGVNQSNFKLLRLIKADGFAAIKYFAKKRPLKKGP